MTDVSNKYDLNNIWKANSKSGESITMSVYMGNMQFTVFPSKDDRRFDNIRVPLTYTACIYIRDLLSEVSKSEGDIRKAYVELAYDINTKKYEPNTCLVFGKKGGMYYVEVSSKKSLTTPILFPIKPRRTFSVDSITTDADEKLKVESEYEFQSLCDMFSKESVIALTTASRFNMPPRKSFSNARGGNGGVARNPYRQSAFSSDDDEIAF